MGLLSGRDIARMAGSLGTVANAALVLIAPTGAPGIRGETTEGAPSWTGTALGYLSREASDQQIDGREVASAIDTFTLLDAGGAPVSEIAGPRWKGTIVHIQDRRATPTVTVAWRVVDVRHDANRLLDSVRLYLAEPKAA